MHRPKVFISRAVRVTSSSESSSDCIDNFSDTSSLIPSWGVFSPWPTLGSIVVFTCPRRGVIPLSSWLFPSWGLLGTTTPLHELVEVSDLDKFFNLSFSVWHSSLVCQLFLRYRHLRVRSTLSGLATFLDGGINSTFIASSKIFPLSAIKGVASCELVTPIVFASIPPTRSWSVLLLLFVLPLVSTRLCSSLISELSQLLQLHKLDDSPPKLVQTCNRLHAQVVSKRFRPQGHQHVMHCYIQA